MGGQDKWRPFTMGNQIAAGSRQGKHPVTGNQGVGKQWKAWKR
jgi:hypothetical protein